MAIETRCPNADCRKSFKVADEQVGRTARCKHCSTRFRIRPGQGELIEPGSGEGKPAKIAAPTPEQTQSADQIPQGAQPVEPGAQVDPLVTQLDTSAGQDSQTASPAAIAANQIERPHPEATMAADASDHEDRGFDLGATLAGGKAPDPAALKAAEEDVPAVWNEGDVILGLYEVKTFLGEGMFGKVYKVRHRNWKIDLAVKIPQPGTFQTDEEKSTFKQECERWINLGLHPNIVSCHYVRELGGIPRVFAEYVDGGSLKEWIDEKKLYGDGQEKALRRMLDVVIQFGWSVQYAHEKGLVHQDVKPANVMMTADGTPKLADFGLAPLGTPAYCSPEQATQQALSHKTDVWSWAVSVLEIFTGERTWPSGTVAAAALEGHLETGPEDESIPKMPQALAELLRRCFQESPDDRPRDMQEIAGRLKEIYREMTDAEYPREEPKAAELLADALNNRAVSLLDLGRQEEAEKLFEEALKADPHHPEATYNRGLLLWRSSRITDDVLVTQLEEVRKSHPHDWRDEYLLGLVHLERGDYESAVQLFESAEKQAPGEQAVQSALRAAWDSRAPHTPRVFEGHTGGVTSVSISPDGRFALSGSADKTLRLWELGTGRCLRTFEGHTDGVGSVSISPDGRFGLSVSWDGAPRLWELGTGRCLRTFKGLSESVTSVSISPDGRFALSGSVDKTLRLWELGTGRCLRTFEGHTDVVNSVSLSPDGRFGVSGSCDRTLRLWKVAPGCCVRMLAKLGLHKLARGRCVRTFKGHTGYVTSVSISAHGRFALSGSADHTVRLWELATGRCLRTFEGHLFDVTSVSISTDARFGLSVSRPPHRDRETTAETTGRLWDLATGRCLRTFEGHTESVTSVSISPHGRFALSASSDKTVRLWELNRGPAVPAAVALPRSAADIVKESWAVRQATEAARRSLEAGRPSEAIAEISRARQIPGYERNAELLAFRAEAGFIGRVCTLESAWCLRTFEGHTGHVQCVCISPDSRFALSGSADKTLRLWELGTGRCLRTFEGHSGAVTSVSITQDGRFALSGSFDSTVRLWELATGHCLRAFKGDPCFSWIPVIISPDGRFALSGDLTPRLWELATGHCLGTFEEHFWNVTSVSMSPDGRFALSGGEDSTLRLWELATGRCLHAFKGGAYGWTPVSISPDGRFGLSGYDDETLRLWELATARCLRTFEGHTDLALSVIISPDGRFALSGSRDKTLRLWEVGTGRCLRTFKGHTESVTSVSISPDGRFALSGSRDKTLRLWQLVWSYEFPEPAGWDEGARPHLETFLTLHCPYGEDGLTRVGKPEWNDEDFQKLLKQLQYRGYGWLRPGGVRRQLEKMTREWTGPPPLPGESSGTPPPVQPAPDQKPQERDVIRVQTARPAPSEESETVLDLAKNQPDTKPGRTPVRAKMPVKAPSKGVRCSCGFENPRDNSFCTQCGKLIQPAAHLACPHCRKAVPEGVRFCTHCGKKVASAVDLATASEESSPDKTAVRPSGPSQDRTEAERDPEATIVEPVPENIVKPEKADQEVPAEWCMGDVILGRYEVKSILGVGGFGRVYRVYDRERNVDLAVKSPRPEFVRTDEQREDFAAHYEMWLRLGHHPNVVCYHGVRALGGIPRVFAEYLDGGSLKDWIDSGKLYEGRPERALERILDIAVQFAAGLQYLHEQGMVHLDVKPSNVLMTKTGTCKLDGSAFSTKCASGKESVECRAMTPAYCSPEQAAHQPVGQKTDVWSWGLSVLEMFSGEVTWISGQVAPEVFEAYLETGPEDASIPKMPEALVALLRRCFQRNAEGRPTAGDIVRELSRLKREPISGPSTAKAGSKSKPSPKELKELVDKLLRRAREKREKPIAIEGYTIEKELGRAGMAAVYLARQEQSGKQVALRVLHPRAGPDKRAEAMWQRELEMLKDLKHPNIVEILDFGRAGDVLFLVMEFCNGGSVAQLMERRGGSLRLEEASTIMFHTLDGLIYLHDNGIVHRDLKPSNILLNGPDGLWVAKIQVSELAGRFARHVGLATSDDLDLDGGVAGTLAFMSRPQVINFRYAKPEVDVWAAAACLYNMLTGKYPRDFPRGQDPLRTILSTDAVPILKRNPSIPTGLAEVIDRALIDKPEISFKTAAELKQALERAL